MQFFNAHLLETTEINAQYSRLRLGGCRALERSRAGQFVMLRGGWEGVPLLPRAYSVLWVAGDQAEFLVQRVGRGSNLLATLKEGQQISVLGPLGSSFPVCRPNTVDIMVAGGCGLAPLYMAARQAHHEGCAEQIELLIGARHKSDLALVEDLQRLGLQVNLATEDGSVGHQGVVTDLLRQRLARSGPERRVMACGPKGMLLAVRAAAREVNVPCFLSLEAPMACGIGACLGCAVEGRSQPYVYVCKDGPVFDGEEVWP